jgi:vacuolar-type H+-ATPase subunit I/STV1
MKINYGKTIAVVVIIVGLWLINMVVRDERDHTNGYKKTIDSLNIELVKIDSIHKKQDDTIMMYKDSIVYLDKIIEVNKANINKLKEKHDKTRDNIIQYSNTQLDSFFSNRYGH